MVYKIFEGDGPSPTPLDQGPTRSLGSLAREWTTTGLRPAKLSYKATTDPWPAAQNLNYHPVCTYVHVCVRVSYMYVYIYVCVQYTCTVHVYMYT